MNEIKFMISIDTTRCRILYSNNGNPIEYTFCYIWINRYTTISCTFNADNLKGIIALSFRRLELLMRKPFKRDYSPPLSALVQLPSPNNHTAFAHLNINSVWMKFDSVKFLFADILVISEVKIDSTFLLVNFW